MTKRIVIIGAGHAGGTAAALLRQYGHEGPITLIGEEPAAPYQRPPLSKAWLKGEADLEALHDLIERQGKVRLEYFQPHGFDHESLKRMYANSAFLMFGTFHKQQLIGYFFLRCFWNRKCFVGRLIDQPFERKGIGRIMNQIMYHIAWRSGFRCMTTVSRKNQDIMRSHERNPHAQIVGELANDYLLIEFVHKSKADC